MERTEFYQKLIRFNSLSRELNELYRNIGRQYGLPDCALWILYVLRETDKSYTQSQLCDRLFQPKQSINSALKKLNDAGMLELKYLPNNKKSKYILLTEAGIELAEKTADKLMGAEQRALSKLSEREQDLLLNIFDKYINSLKPELNKFRKEGMNDE